MKEHDLEAIEPELYQHTLESLQLKSVCLDSLSASSRRELFGQGGISVELTTDAFAKPAAGQYLAYIKYSLRAARDAEAALVIDATFCVVFDATEPVPDGFFDVYKEVNLVLTTMPFARELIASVTSRMDLPTLTLPYHLFVPTSDEVAVESAEAQ